MFKGDTWDRRRYASGILFGAWEGAAVIWSSNVLAAAISFALAGGVGRQFAEKIIAEETGASVGEVGLSFEEEDSAEGAGGGKRDLDKAFENPLLASFDEEYLEAEKKEDDSAFKATWTKLQEKLAESDPVKQAGIITLYRFAPHPFSASNYLFGLTNLRFAPYVAGTGAGMLPWAVLYAVCGASGGDHTRTPSCFFLFFSFFFCNTPPLLSAELDSSLSTTRMFIYIF